MLMIRLQRKGKIHQPFYRLVVGERRSKLKGEQLEELGWFEPAKNQTSFNKERILYWMKNGAKLSDTVHNLLVSGKIIEGAKIAVHKKAKKHGPERAEGKEGEKIAAPAVAPKA